MTELRSTIKQKGTEVDVLAKTNRKLNKKITDQHLELEKRNNRSKMVKAGHKKLRAEAKVKNSQVATNAIPQTSDNTDIPTIIREEQNEQLAEETDKNMRSCNLILKVSVLIYA